MIERDAGLQVRPKKTEVVEVAVPDPPPVHKFNSELERGVRLPDELVLIDTE